MSEDFQKSYQEFKSSLLNEPEVTVEGESLGNEQIPVEQELPSAQAEDQFQTSEHKAPPKRKNKNTFEQRIAALHSQNLARQEALMNKERENEYLKQQLQQKYAEVAEKDEFANLHFESSIKAREIALMNELIAAKEEGNYQKEVELEAALFDVKAQKHTQDLYKNQIQPHQQRNNNAQQIAELTNANQQYSYQEYQEPSVDPYQPINENYEEWLQNNSWANPDTQDYDHDLMQDAVQISTNLEKMLKLKKRSDLIGTKEFYDAIDNALQEEYGIGGHEQQEEPVYQQPHRQEPRYAPSPQQSYPVEPVARGNLTMAEQYNRQYQNRPQSTASKPSSLTQNEYTVARNLQIPNGPGSVIQNVNDRLKIYNKMKNYPKSPHEGGSEYRLTILD